jgi:large subunit ribosomal protein L17
MRHGKKFNHLGRKPAHRKAMLANMASSLLKHKRVNTTLAKAKALRTYIEPLLTKAKSDTTHSRRVVFKYLKDKFAVTELFRDVAPKIINRPGGYTRILKTGNRLGDNAEMCLIELVDFNETLLTEPKTGAGAGDKKKQTRRGGRKKEQDDDPQASPKAAKEPTKEDVAEDVEIIEETANEAVEETPAEEPKAEAGAEEPDNKPKEDSDKTENDSGDKKENPE